MVTPQQEEGFGGGIVGVKEFGVVTFGAVMFGAVMLMPVLTTSTPSSLFSTGLVGGGQVV